MKFVTRMNLRITSIYCKQISIKQNRLIPPRHSQMFSFIVQAGKKQWGVEFSGGRAVELVIIRPAMYSCRLLLSLLTINSNKT